MCACVAVCVRSLKQKAQSDLQLQQLSETGKGLAWAGLATLAAAQQKTMTCAYACLPAWLPECVCVKKLCVCASAPESRQRFFVVSTMRSLPLLLPFDSRPA